MRLCLVLLVFNGTVWGVTLLVSARYSFVLGLGLLAFTFGLRHGVDADHIAAIDNVTRKLMHDGKRPAGVGFFFSLGHSTIVVVLSGCVVVAATVIQRHTTQLQVIGGMIGTGVSALFLYAVGIINLLVLIDLSRVIRQVMRGDAGHDVTADDLLAQRGVMPRFFGPVMRAIDTSWKMYPLGLLFGLGFDTASEVALLGISATTAGRGIPIIVVMLFPLLFAAGMSLVDTADSILMVGAYGWAFVRPMGKLYYNLTITLVSVLVALVVGTLEITQVIASQFELRGDPWGWLTKLDFERMGYVIIGLFIVGWLGSTLLYKTMRFAAAEAANPVVAD